jgi:hypothetical protein
VTISLRLEKEVDPENPSDTSYYTREVTRETNEEGMFRRLKLELSRIGQEYGVEEDEVHEMYFSVCCSKKKLIEVLQGKDFTKWNELEDLALREPTEST